MKAVLVTDFPERFVNESILPELSRRVEVVLVASHYRVRSVDLASYAPDVVLRMNEMVGHSSSDVLIRYCREQGIPLQSLSRKKSTWTFLPSPKEKEEMNQNHPSNRPIQANGRATIGDAPGVREAIQAVGNATPVPSTPVKKDPIAEAIQSHADAMTLLARAITEATAAIIAGAAAFQIQKQHQAPRPKRNEAAEALDLKLLEIVEKYPGLCATEIHVFVKNGGGGEKMDVAQQAVHDRLSRLVKTEVLRREGTGGQANPYRYFVAESST